MRLNTLRAASTAALALVLWSCTDTGVTDPAAAPAGPRLDVVSANGLMITEVMPDPSRVADGSGEWFELYNGGADSINLKGHRIVSASGATATESHTIASDVWIHAGERSEEHTSELQSRQYLVCRLLLEKKKTKENTLVHKNL